MCQVAGEELLWIPGITASEETFSLRTKHNCTLEFYTALIDDLISEKTCAPLNLNRLNLLKVEVDDDQLFLELCDLNEVSPFIKEELEPSVSGPSHSENNKSDKMHHISNIRVNFLSHAKHLCSKLFNMS
jgi:hypothetical protein